MDRLVFACGCSVGFLAAGFFLADLHRELKHQLWARGFIA